MGTLGLSLLPILIVDHGLKGFWPPLVMGLTKGALFVGVLLGGILSDRMGAKGSVTLSFLLEGTGLLALLLVPHWGGWASALALGGLALVAQLGNAMTPSSSRILLFSLVGTTQDRREAQGWLRTANNLGVVFSSGLGWILTSLGITGIFLIDATTSYLAAILLWTVLSAKRLRATAPPLEVAARGVAERPDWWVPALKVAGMVGLTSLAYQIVETALAVRFRLEYGELGVSRFSAALLINASLCAVFGVIANRHIQRIDRAFALGFTLTLAALGLVAWTPAHVELLYPIIFLLTLGEIFFYALAQFALMSLVPAGPRSGARYGRLLMLQTGAKWVGGAVAFPLVVERNGAGWLAAGIGLLGAWVWGMARDPLRKLEAGDFT